MVMGSFSDKKRPADPGCPPPVFSCAEAIRIERAQEEDIPAIAAVFTESFQESVLHHCGKIPKPKAMQDVFSLVRSCEPAAALIARTADGEVAGYCFAPVSLYRLWLGALLRGAVFVWLWRWLTGQYGFGLHPVKVIFLNKLNFFRSALTPSKSAGARILSIAVASKWRSRGIAGQLMTEAVEYFAQQSVARVRLEVRPDNVPAIRVYEKFGFVPSGFTQDSQGPWLIMFKEMRQL